MRRSRPQSLSNVAASKRRSAARADGPVMAAPQVLSVVDRQAAPVSFSSPDGGIELRVGFWRIREAPPEEANVIPFQSCGR